MCPAREFFAGYTSPLAPALRSINSTANCSALFTDFPATKAKSDFPRPCVIGYGSSPSRCGLSRAIGRSRDLPVPAQEASAHARFFDPRRAVQTLALTRPSMLPSTTFAIASAPRMQIFARLYGCSRHSPKDASLSPFADGRARLRVNVERYSFIVSDLHRLLLAGLSGVLRNIPYVISS